jgi:hypothetical protein
MQHVRALSDDIGARPAGTSAETGAARYIHDQLASFGYEVELQSFRLEAYRDDRSGESRNVIARPPGGACRIVAGGHYDSVADGPGANDNASGTAVTIEMARAVAAGGQVDDVCFVLFGSEEIGLIGSYHYVATMTQQERDALVAMLNFDMFGVGERWPLIGSSDLVYMAGEVAESLGLRYELSSAPPNVGSDHVPFLDAGFDSIMFNCFCDANYHTSGDRPEFVRPERLAEAGALGMGLMERLLPEGEE